MLNPKYIPTPLIPPQTRAPIEVVQPPGWARLRTFYLIVHALVLLLRVFGLWIVGVLTEERLGDLLRGFCQRMGVLWIKAGQLLSMRADLVPPGVRAQLAQLFDRVQGFSGDRAVQLVEAELGLPLDDCFSYFDRKPLASASIAQVHKARLREGGSWVAVKVRRPDASRISAHDLAFIHFLIRCLVRLRFKPEGRWLEMYWELQEAMLEELDYRFEASNIRRMKHNLRRHGIYVPRLFPRYSTAAVLVMELIQGVVMSDYLLTARLNPAELARWREENNVKPSRVARQLLHSLFRQCFEENLFHGDLHPGNIVLLRNSRIAFLDFGSIGSMERDLTRNVDLYIQSLGTRQYSRMIDLFFLFAPSLPTSGLEECKNEMMRRLQSWDLRCQVPELPYPEKSFNFIQDEMVWLASTYGVSPVWTFFRMTRVLTTMDTSLRELIPESRFHDLVNSYYGGRMLRTRDKLPGELRNGTQTFHEWLDYQQRLMDDMRFRSGIVRRAAQVFERTASTVSLFFADLLARLANGLLLIGALLLLPFLHQMAPRLLPLPPGVVVSHVYFPVLDMQVWLLIFLVLLYVWFRLRRLSQRLREKEEDE